MKKSFDVVLFDFDGTIADTAVSISKCALLALHAFGYDEPDEARLKEFIGPPLVDSFMRYSGDRETAQKMVDEYRVHYSSGGMFEAVLYEGAEQMLSDLCSSGCKLAVASSKPGSFVSAIADRLGVGKYFSFISAPEVGHVNPTKAQLISRAMEQLGAEKQRTVMVGDRCFDIVGAKQTGIASIGAVYGFGGKDELLECGADMLAFNASQITELIFGEGNS